MRVCMYACVRARVCACAYMCVCVCVRARARVDVNRIGVGGVCSTWDGDLFTLGCFGDRVGEGARIRVGDGCNQVVLVDG